MKHLKRYWHLFAALILNLLSYWYEQEIRECIALDERRAGWMLLLWLLTIVAVVYEFVRWDDLKWNKRINRAYHQGAEDARKEKEDV